jgi:hypothetical protein
VHAASPAADIIEGEFRVIASREAVRRPSPNRRRAVARILCWNAIFVGVVLAVPYLFA